MSLKLKKINSFAYPIQGGIFSEYRLTKRLPIRFEAWNSFSLYSNIIPSSGHVTQISNIVVIKFPRWDSYIILFKLLCYVLTSWSFFRHDYFIRCVKIPVKIYEKRKRNYTCRHKTRANKIRHREEFFVFEYTKIVFVLPPIVMGIVYVVDFLWWKKFGRFVVFLCHKYNFFKL